MAERQRGWDQTTSYRVIEDHFEIHLSYEKMTNLKIHIVTHKMEIFYEL